MVRTSHALVEIPSRAAAASTPAFNDSGSRKRDAPGELLARRRRRTASGGLVGDDDELGLASGEAHLDSTGLELCPDLERGLAEEVEQVEMQRGGERLAHPAGELGGLLVAHALRRRRAPAGSAWT